jgi:hypothetical protein
MRKKFKAGMANAALVLASLAVTYLIAELVFFRLFLPHMSLNLRPHLPDRADFFLQSSKSRHVPHDYIALVGDSYAQGMGDWLLAAGGKNDKPYHSANVLHDLLGTDVMTLGRAASGSAEGMVLRLTRILGDNYCYLFPPIEQPKRFFIYFYEGNDIDDNNEFLQKHAVAGRDLRGGIDKVLADEYGVVSSWRCHGHLGDMMFRMARFLVRESWARHNVLDLPPTKNRVMIAGTAVGTPELQVPSPGLDDAAIDAGVVVYERSVAWLRRQFPQVPMTVVYLPSPAAVYRNAGDQVTAKDVYLPAESRRLGRIVVVDGPTFPVPAVYRNSQAICEKIRQVSLAQGTGFIDTRPTLRKVAAERAVHGPRDWNHLNETGYRTLAGLLAPHKDDQPADACDDRWSP